MATLNAEAARDVLAALAASPGPDDHWIEGDELCDCMLQRIWDTTNPYIAQTKTVRLCCLWQKLYDQYPETVQDVAAYYNRNEHAWVATPAPWDSEDMAMPVYLWVRQVAVQRGISVGEARVWCNANLKQRPQAVPKGTGRESRRQPSEAVVRAGHEARLRLSGWLLPGERMPS